MDLVRLAFRVRLIDGSTSKVRLTSKPLICVPRSTIPSASALYGGRCFASTKAQKPTPKNAEDKRSQYKPPVHIKSFFAQYPEFDYDPNRHYIEEFYRMTKKFRWNSKGTLEQQAKFRAARENVDRASVHQFNEIYGTDINDHAAWQKLFDILRMGEAPKRIGACKRRVREYHANLCDMVHNHARGKGTKRFRSSEELRDYTIRTGKFFPQKHADAGGVLRFLLRHLLNPPSNPHTHSPHKPEVKKAQ